MIVLENELMKNHTTFRVGGPARRYMIPETLGDVQKVIFLCQESGEPLYVVGNGSNLLVSDSGIDGTVMELGDHFAKITREDNLVYAEAGARLSQLAGFAMRNSLAGLVPVSGIPGTVGGAVVMNAGAYDGEISDYLEYADVLTGGELVRYEKKNMHFSYRHSAAMEQSMVVVGAGFLLPDGDPAAIADEMKALAGRRREKQPLEYPSAGSTFKRPEGHFAGKLIMDAGLAGFRIGGACVSEKHCGFILNQFDGTAQDVYDLIIHVQKTVMEKFGVLLEPEVRILGEFN